MSLKLKSHPALLIVDMQNTFCHPNGVFVKNVVQVPEATIERATNTTNRLRKAFNERGLPVIFLGYGFSKDYSEAGNFLEDLPPQAIEQGIALRDTWDAAIIDELKLDVAKGEVFVEKYRTSGFYETKLEALLKEEGIDQLVVTGVATNVCVESTVRDAHHRGLKCVTVSDGVGTTPDEAHEASLMNLRLYFGGTATGAEIEQALSTK